MIVKIIRNRKGGFRIQCDGPHSINKIITWEDLDKIRFLSFDAMEEIKDGMKKAEEYGEAVVELEDYSPIDLAKGVNNMEKIMKKKNIIEIQEPVKIEQENEIIYLEKGDKIRVLEEKEFPKKGEMVFIVDQVTHDEYRGYITGVDKLNNEISFKYKKNGKEQTGMILQRFIKKVGPFFYIPV